MSRLEITVWMKTPSGDVHDITSRTDIDSIGRISEEIEEDLTALTHPDMDLTLYDDDGWVWALFEGAARTDVYEFWVEREKTSGGSERVFGGIADLPFGVQRATKDRTVSVTVYGYGKLLELASAETIQRTVTGRTGTVTSGTAVVTCNDTTDLAAGDEITLDNGTNRETRTIAVVTSSTALTTTETWTNGFTAAALTLETPYRRDDVDSIAGALFEAAGITEYVVDVAQALATVPFPSALNETGLPGTAPKSMLESSGAIKVYTNSKVYSATSASSGFTDGGASNVKVDWRPYKATEPATLRDASSVDNGARAWDHDGGDYYSLTIDVNENLQLYKNGSALVQVQAGGTGGGATNTYDVTSVEWHEGLSEVWVGYSHLKDIGGVPTSTNGGIKRYDSSGTLLGSFATVSTLRYSQTLGGMLAQEYSFSGAGDLGDDGPLALYVGDVRTYEYEHADGVETWTLRAMGDHILAVREGSGKSYVVIWDQATREIVADHEISTSTGAAYATVFDAGGTATPLYLCWAAGSWAVVSTAFSGSVPYADFDGQSCAAALRSLAVISAAYLWVDEHRTGYLVGRDSATLQDSTEIEIDTPLEQTVWPLSEWHRTSVLVTGETEEEADIEVLVGETGDSALRLEVAADIPLNEGFASALANAYLSWTSGLGRQLDEEIEEPTTGRVRVLDRVTRDGRTYRVLRAESDLVERTQTVQLVEEGV